MINNKLEIFLDPEQQVFFTSDTHFGHRNVLKFCNRPFESVKDMEQQLVANWNNFVTDQDIVFHLGDFSWWDSNTEITRICSKLNGKQIYLVPGNHDLDKGWRKVPDRMTILGAVVQLWIRDHKTGELLFKAVLSHYPLMTWNRREEGVPNLHGHLHGLKGDGRDGKENPDLNLPYHWNQCDVGVDVWDYKPVNLMALEVALEHQENHKNFIQNFNSSEN